ncbi:BTB/POZ protein [Rhizophagus irregularis DAOM 181602=DAOM 197198]|uniref:Uncharacterized protein n=1 Tax=Rhizophagus irregularis (strain DAOM 181602 / DAOM 197198 / MUCL 43194) TaxID=747089 RepID=U9UTU8_RHIID|nr:BTB/POZ protein [Rhizophagus irregularis DAOM 181602=DAOM 197198]
MINSLIQLYHYSLDFDPPTISQTSFQSNSLLELQRFCIDCMTKHPQKMFKSLNFTSLSEKALVSLIKRDDLQMKEVEIWEHVLKWRLTNVDEIIDSKIVNLNRFQDGGSQDGFSPKMFHELCNNIFHTITFIKDNFKDPILSHVNLKNINRALFYHTRSGPAFNRDLYIGVEGPADNSKEYDFRICVKNT